MAVAGMSFAALSFSRLKSPQYQAIPCAIPISIGVSLYRSRPSPKEPTCVCCSAIYRPFVRGISLLATWILAKNLIRPFHQKSFTILSFSQLVGCAAGMGDLVYWQAVEDP